MVGLARHDHRSPDTLSADDVRRYLLHPVQERHLARSRVNQYGCAFRFLYGRVLGLDAIHRPLLAACPARATRGLFVAPGLQAHPPLPLAGTGGEDKAAGAGPRTAGHAGGEPAGARGRAGLQPKNRS